MTKHPAEEAASQPWRDGGKEEPKRRPQHPQPAFQGAGPMKHEDIPDVVRESVRDWEKRNGVWPHSALRALRWDSMNGCYCFTWAGMFYGVEKADGYIHT